MTKMPEKRAQAEWQTGFGAMTYKGLLSPGPPTENKGAAELTDTGLLCGLGFVKFGQMVDPRGGVGSEERDLGLGRLCSL